MAESELADHQTSRTASTVSEAQWTLRRVRCWPAKLAAAPSSSTADERTAKGGFRPAMAFPSFSMAWLSPEATASTKSPESATPGGTGRPWRAASPRPTAFEPNSDLSLAFAKETSFFTLPEQRDFAGIAIDADPGTIFDAFGGLAGADDTGDAVLARDNRRMRKQSAVVGHDAAKKRQQNV